MYLRRIDFVYHSTLGLRVIKKKRYTLNKVSLSGGREVRIADYVGH